MNRTSNCHSSNASTLGPGSTRRHWPD